MNDITKTQTSPIHETRDVELSDLINFVEKMLDTDTTKLHEESMRSNKIFATLHKIKHIQDKKLRDLLQLKSECEHARWIHYSGKGTGRHYKEEPLPEALLKTDIEKYMSVDQKVVLVREAVKTQDAICVFIEESLKQASRRGFDIKNAIDWVKLTSSS